MIIRQLDKIAGSEAEVSGPTWVSRRLLLAGDGMGFSLHDTIIHGGTVTAMHYTNHLEAVYCIEGRGEIEDCATGARHSIAPGTVYALNENDKHILRAEETLRLVCVFNPPLTGLETHDETGSYPLLTELPETVA